MIFYFKKRYIFEIDFYFTNAIDVKLIKDLLIITNKYYPSFSLNDSNKDYKDIKWEDFILTNEEKNLNEYTDLELNVPLYFFRNLDDVPHRFCHSKLDTLEGDVVPFRFFFHITDDGINALMFEINACVFTDNVIVGSHFTEINGETVMSRGVKIDQSNPAKLNRDILAECIKSIELYLKPISYEISSHILNKDEIYKYGIKDGIIRDIFL